jgi:PAS domain S-box-containing protein
VFFKDTTSRYLHINPAFCRWLGRREKDVVGKSIYDLWPPAVAEALAADDRRVLDGDCVEKEEPRPNPRELRTLKTVKMPIRDARGRIAGILGYFADVTDEKRRDEDYRQTLRYAVVGRLAAGLTHDLNQFFKQMQGNAALLGASGPGDLPPRDMAEQVEAAASRAADLTQRLIVFTRTDLPAAEVAHINDAVAEVTNLFRAVLDRRVVLEVRLGDRLPGVHAPVSQLTQIVLNLCLNARDAMPDGGRITVETDLVPLAEHPATESSDASPFGRRRGAYVRLRVGDTGRGMTRDIRARLFDPWYTAKSGGNGSGLGLSIVQDVARRHGGWVECTSSVAEGTSFSVFLPPDDSDPLAVPAGPPTASLEPTSILLSDNEPAIVFICRHILEANGYQVLEAGDGRKAAELYRCERARIGLVLLDQNMPGMSGVEVLRELIEADPSVRVVLMSGAPQELMPTIFSRNLRGFLPKPFHTWELLDAVRDALAGD